jgi:predicted permease
MWNQFSLDILIQDVRFGLRMLRKSPIFTAVAVLTLALGIGANTAIFSVINGVLLRPLPYQEPGQLVRIFGVWPTQPSFPNSPADFVDYRARNHVFDNFAVFVRQDLDFTAKERPLRLKGMGVSSEFFSVLGWHPLLGRDFSPAEETRGSNQVVILSHAVWQNVFNYDPGIVGKSLMFSGLPYTVVGVMPAGVEHVGGDYQSLPQGETVEVWSPFPLLPLRKSDRSSHFLNGVARLRPGVSVAQANQEMNILATELEHEYPDTNRDGRIKLVPLKEEIVGRARPMLLLLFGAAAFVLLIACVNVANLMLARSAARQPEIAVRSALGAGRLRLVRQLLTENLMIALAGGGLGLLFALWGMDALLALAPDKLPRLQSVHMDARVFVFALASAVLTGFLFGLVPALGPLGGPASEALKERAQGGSGGTGRGRVRGLLVVAETSLALMLLVGAGLLLRSFQALRTEAPGFRPDHVLTMSIDLPSSRYPEEQASQHFYQSLTEKVSALPGVAVTGLGSDIPWTSYDENSGFGIVGKPRSPDDHQEARYHFVTPDYFRAIGTPLIAGRFFTSSDTANSPHSILVNAAFARRYFSAENAVGKQLDLWGFHNVNIVGVVGDVKDTPNDLQAKPAFYWDDWQFLGQSRQVLVVRSSADPSSLVSAVRREVLALDKDLPLSDVRTLNDVTSMAVSGARFTLLLVGLFGGLALLLAAVGLYGVMSYAVTQRTQEIGIRMALGAQTRDVIRLVLERGMTLTLLGVAIGLAGAFALTRLMAGLLFGVTPTNALVFATVPVCLIVVALLACFLPARRATKVDPLVALRYE